DVKSEYGKGSVFTVSIPQSYKNHAKLAEIKNPEGKNVLIYERRHINARSVTWTMDNLGVNYKLVTTAAEFYEEIKSQIYQYVFVASVLYDNVKKTYAEFDSKAEFVLIAEFGEAIADRNVSIITTPIFCLPVANLLNGVSDSFITSLSSNVAARLIVPDAKVLVVDDINTNLKVAEGLMQHYKIHVDLCRSGLEAIKAIKTARYDLVLMDHMMPGMDGIETTARIRALGDKEPFYRSLPIVALTANAVSGTREMFLSSGFDDFLSKPIDTLRLHEILEKWIPKEKQKLAPENYDKQEARELPGGKTMLSIDGIDAKKGIAMSRGSYENYIRMLGIFYKDGLYKLNEIKESFSNKNINLYVTYVHGMKSAAAIVGAEKISDESKMLEMAGKRGDWAFIENNNAGYLRELELLLENIKRELPGITPSGKKTDIDTRRLTTTLNGLREALNNFDSTAINSNMDNLLEYSGAADLHDDIERIGHNKMIGEYDEAIAIIDKLLQKLGKH
ncbi:MAG: response regulator, partial [Acidobacteriota bacterium]|nr:response regulator [Acidobacteriota bacterium]